MSREQLYVAMTRGRDQNVAYTVTEQPLELHSDHRPDAPTSGREVLATVMSRVDESSRSAHETLRSSYEQAESLQRLVPEYEDALAIAHDARIAEALAASLQGRGVDADSVRADPAYGALARRLAARAEEGGDIEADLRAAVEMRELATADSVAQVLTHRLDRANAPTAPVTPSSADVSPGLAGWLQERNARISARHDHLLAQARNDPPPWLRTMQIGGRRVDDDLLQRAVIYRDRHGVTDSARPLGTEPERGSDRHAQWSTLNAEISKPAPRPTPDDDADRGGTAGLLERARRRPTPRPKRDDPPAPGYEPDRGPQVDR